MKTLLIVIGLLLSTTASVTAYWRLENRRSLSKSQQALSPWTTFHNSALGFSIDYPNNGTYKVHTYDYGQVPTSMHHGVMPTPVLGYSISIAQNPTVEELDHDINDQHFDIYVSSDPDLLNALPTSLQPTGKTTTINGLLYQNIAVDPLLAGRAGLNEYGYAIERNGKYYVFESHKAADNPIFDQMIQTVQFDQTR